jgi:hypothetical protein
LSFRGSAKSSAVARGRQRVKLKHHGGTFSNLMTHKIKLIYAAKRPEKHLSNKTTNFIFVFSQYSR